MDEETAALANLKNLLKIYNQQDLLAAVAGLQLVPENANRLIRLETLAQTVASIPFESGKPSISNPKLRSILNSYPLIDSPIESSEDPCANLFTESFSFHGNGSYIIFPGIVEESAFIMRHLVESLFISPQIVRDQAFLDEVKLLITTVLTVSDLIARRAGLTRGVEHNSPISGKMIVPDAARFSELKRAVTYSKEELTELLRRRGGSLTALERITAQPGFEYDRFELETGEVFCKPIVKFDETYVAAIPSFLLIAARHTIINLAIEKNILEQVVTGYAQRAWLTVLESFERLHNIPLPFQPPKHNVSAYYRDGLFQIDTDKIMYVGLMVDPLTDYDLEKPFHPWETGDLSKKLAERWAEMEENIFNSLPANEWLNLFLLHGIGRSAAIGFNGVKTPAGAPFIHLSVSDLESISWLESGKQLLFWHYARAAERVRRNSVVMSWSSLDEFQMYRLKNYGYYFSDDERPTMLMIQPGTAAGLRLELSKKRDFHAVHSYRGADISEVTTFHDTISVPVYIDLKSLRGGQLVLLVEGLPVNIWVISSERGKEKSTAREFYFQLADAISHWLWQLTPDLYPILEEVSHIYDHIILEIYLIPNDSWTINNSGNENATQQSIEVKVRRDTGTLHITFNSSILNLLDGADNSGEREIMRIIISSFGELLSAGSQEKLSEKAVESMLDARMPLGIKKKALVMNSNLSPQLDGRDLPGYHKISKPNIEELLDDLGEFLRTDKSLSKGNIPDENRTKVLGEGVSYFYNRLEKLVATLNPDGLLEWLISYHEAVVQEKAHNSLTIPTRLACFLSEPEMMKDLQKTLPELAMAGRDNRFLIEYVTARQPNGFRPMSLSVYDELLALASEIIEFGTESDLIHLKLADFHYSILPSGRLGANRTGFAQIMEAYFPSYGLAEMQRTRRNFDRNWDRGESPQTPSEKFLKIGAATKIEFGHTLRELNELMIEAYNISQESNSFAVARMPLTELINELVSRLEWSVEKVEDALNLLSLKKRDQFLKPAAPFQAADVYPWRYNRPLSYIRRPFIQREGNGILEVLWGPRNLFDVMNYLTHLCLNGRLQAQSPEMKKLISEMNNERGEDFNSLTAELFRTHGDFIVRERVKKIGRKRISDTEGDLGDIDVLIANPKKKTIMVVECKDLAIARTPNEMSNEIMNLFQGSESKKSIVEKHTKRIEWIKTNLEDVMSWLNIQSKGKWRVEGLIAVNQPLFTPYLKKSPIPVVSYEELARSSF